MKIIGLILSLFLITEVNAKEEDIDQYIQDDSLKTCILDQYNMDNQTEKTTLSLDELKEMRKLSCSGNMIANTKGIEKLVNLVELNLSNNNISSINLTKNLELRSLVLKNNLLDKIDVSKNVNLQELDLSNNKLEEIFLTNNILLKKLDISHNHLTELNIKDNLNLTNLSINGNDFLKIIDNNESSFQSPIQYNPYFSSKIENVSYTSSNNNIVTISEKGELTFISKGEAKITKRYIIKNGENIEEIKEVNDLYLINTNQQIKHDNKIRNVPYIFILGIVLFLLGTLVVIKHINLDQKNK